MEIKNEYSEKLKFKIVLRDNNNKYKVKFIYNCLEIIYLCKDYCYRTNIKTNKMNIIRYINKTFGTNYCNNKIKRIIIIYHNKVIYKSRIYYKANKEINISINTIKFKKLKKIKKINKLEKLKRNLLYNNVWSNFITNEKYISETIILDPIIDKFEINIITNINGPNNVINKNDDSVKLQKNNSKCNIIDGEKSKTIINIEN